MPLPFRLYLVTDRTRCAGRPLAQVVLQAADAGVKAVQFREKDWPVRRRWQEAKTLSGLLREHATALFINDRVDIAVAVGAAGVHLPEDSVPPYLARRLLGAGALVGMSVHSVEAGRRAEREGADFLTLGAVFETPGKQTGGLALLEAVCRSVAIPVLAIGGVTPERVSDCLQAGAWGVAVISAITAAPDIGEAVAAFRSALGTL